MKKSTKQGIQALIILILLPFMFWFDALVIRDMWSWFIFTGFGLKKITVLQAFGLVFFVGTLRMNMCESMLIKMVQQKDEDATLNHYLSKIMALALGWGIGAIIYHTLVLR